VNILGAYYSVVSGTTRVKAKVWGGGKRKRIGVRGGYAEWIFGYPIEDLG
jgi:hypothetical protein